MRAKDATPLRAEVGQFQKSGSETFDSIPDSGLVSIPLLSLYFVDVIVNKIMLGQRQIC